MAKEGLHQCAPPLLVQLIHPSVDNAPLLCHCAGFTPVVANVLATNGLTFLVPTNAVWARYLPYVRRLNKDQQQQLVGYHILKGNLPLSYLSSAPYKAEVCDSNSLRDNPRLCG